MQRDTRRDLLVQNGEVSLAGSLWLPSQEVAATVLMHPGSGPSDRDNDVYFPPIRSHLLEAGIAVASFDKRGVGGSTGNWEEAPISEQADDALACLDAVSKELGVGNVGLFGHSQGGWVVIEAGSRGDNVAFVITNSGPGVTPGEQERWAMRGYMRRAGIPESELQEVERYYEFLLAMMRSGVAFEEVRTRVDAEGFPGAFESLGLPFLPENAAIWSFMAAVVDHDPRSALEQIDVPLLAIFGEQDPVTPVADSVAVYRGAVRPELLTIEVFPEAGHRIESGDPERLAETYLEKLTSFILGATSEI